MASDADLIAAAMLRQRQRIAEYVRAHSGCQPEKAHLHKSCADVVADGILNLEDQKAVPAFPHKGEEE